VWFAPERGGDWWLNAHQTSNPSAHDEVSRQFKDLGTTDPALALVKARIIIREERGR
jgi:hypothetical protein